MIEWDIEKVMDVIEWKNKLNDRKLPGRRRCLWCENGVDLTSCGLDTTCPKHRLIHDYYLYNVEGQLIHPDIKDGSDKRCKNKEEYREIYKSWYDSLTDKDVEEILIYQASDAINWLC